MPPQPPQDRVEPMHLARHTARRQAKLPPRAEWGKWQIRQAQWVFLPEKGPNAIFGPCLKLREEDYQTPAMENQNPRAPLSPAARPRGPTASGEGRSGPARPSASVPARHRLSRPQPDASPRVLPSRQDYRQPRPIVPHGASVLSTRQGLRRGSTSAAQRSAAPARACHAATRLSCRRRVADREARKNGARVKSAPPSQNGGPSLVDRAGA